MNIRGLIISFLSIKTFFNAKTYARFMLASLAWLCSVVYAADTPQTKWNEWKTSPTTTVKYKELESEKLITIHAKTVVKSSISGFIQFIQDTQHVNNWLDNAKSTHVIEQISIYKNVFVTQFYGLWLIKPRYMLVTSEYWQNKDLSIEIKVQEAKNIRINDSILSKELEKQIKITVINAKWHITPNQDRTLTIEYTFTVDPKGTLPFWITKRFSLKGIWNTMETLNEQLPTSKWQSHHLTHINEPSH